MIKGVKSNPQGDITYGYFEIELSNLDSVCMKLTPNGQKFVDID